MLADALSSPMAIAGLAAWALAAVAASYWVAARGVATASPAEDAVHRAFRNSAIPIVSQLLVRALDLAVAIVLLRLLGPEGNGRYALAIIVWLYVKTFSDFGLSLLATRDIARDRSRAGEIVGSTTLMRWAVLAVTAVPVAVYLGAGVGRGFLAFETATAVLILFASVIPSSLAEAVNAALNGYERMEVAAWLNIGVSFVRVPLVILAALELDVAGVALAALLAATLSADLFRRSFRAISGQPIRWRLDRSAATAMARESWPLLLNALLVNLFFRVDVFIIQAARGDAALGVYDASYKLINLVTIVPAYVTLSIFPALSQRGSDPDALHLLQRRATYLLVWIAWGIVTAATATAGIAIRLLAGDQYLPEGATLLRILIWFAPLSFVNGVAQYVLVAAGLQRRLVPAFVAAVSFNLAVNLALVPAYGARAAAAATVATEAAILLAFWLTTRTAQVHAIRQDLLVSLWRPSLAGVVSAGAALATLRQSGEYAAMGAGIGGFVLLSWMLRVLGPDERGLIRRALNRGGKEHPASGGTS